MDRWAGHLGRVNQYWDVAYVKTDSKGMCRCLLCDTGWMSTGALISHFNGSWHYSTFYRVQADRIANVVEQAKSVPVDRLPSSRWKDEVQALLYQFIAEEKSEILKMANDKLAHYERLDALSSLELAICKAQIRPMFATMQELREYCILDSDFDSTAFVLGSRHGSEVIVPLVKEFLGW